MSNRELEFSKDFVATGQVLFTVGGLNCGPGYIIYIGSDGKIHVKRVPPRNPELSVQFDAAISILEHALLAKNVKIEEKLITAAQSILAPIAKEVNAHMQGK